MKQKLKVVFSKNNLDLLLYKPSIVHPFYGHMEHLSLFRRIRFLIEYFYGYDVYYLRSGKELIGYCTVSSGKNKRYWFATINDIMIGPYFIKKNYRGQGLSFILLDMVLNDANLVFDYAYDYINESNAPSIKATQSVGGIKLFNVSINIFTRQMKKTKNGQYGVYRIPGKRIN